jgi:hypothetical protein
VTRVNRISKPDVLQQNSDRWLSELRSAIENLEQIKNDPKAKKEDVKKAETIVKKAQNKYSHREIKDALVKMFYGKCAYCESCITVVTYGHIEHFYPKSRYADKTFEWHNLLLSCDICNNAQHKGTLFPLDIKGNPLLIDPSDGITEPVMHLKFFWDNSLRLASIYGLDDRGREVERIFGLNRRKELIRERSRHVKMLMALFKLAQQGNSEAMAILKEACQPDAPYRAFALTYIYPYIQNQENRLYDKK